MNKHIPYLVVITILLLIIGFNRCDTTKEPKIIERVIQDTTTVDSLVKRIEYLEALPPDTIKIKINIPKPDSVYSNNEGDVIKKYTTSYTDSLIVARWTTQVLGELKSQDFEYVSKARYITKETVTKWLTRTKTIERTVEKQQRGFLAIGGSIGISDADILYEAELRFQAKDGYSYHLKYITMPTVNEAVMIGITIPIKIKIPFL